MKADPQDWPGCMGWIRHRQLEGFRVGECLCRQCACEWPVAIHPDVVAWKLECPVCKVKNNYFTEFETVERGGGELFT